MSESPTAHSARRARAPLPERVDVAIIGAGMGGLTAGATLAKHGYRVAVFDAHYVAGGCCTQFARGKGDKAFRFDIGLHYIGDCGPEGMIPSMLRPLGIELDYIPMDPEGFDTLVFPDFTFKIPANVETYRQRLKQYFPKETKGIDRYVRFLLEIEHMAQQVARSRGKVTLRSGLSALLRARLAVRYQQSTMDPLLDSITRDPKLRAVILGQHGDYGLPPSEVSALLHAGLAMHYFKGAYYPKGGGQIIADRLAECIEAHGGTVHLRRPIERILIENNRAVGIVTEAKRNEEAKTIHADLVISNADLKQTLDRLIGPSHLPSSWQRRSAGFKWGGAIFMTCLGVKADMAAKGMRATNYWQFDGYDMNAMYREARQATEPLINGCYITSATLKDPNTPGHAPEGVNNIEVMSLVPGKAAYWNVDPHEVHSWRYKKQERYQELKARVEDNMIARLEALFPGTSEHIIFRESATPVTHSRYTRATDGTGYGLAATPDQFLQKRPGYRTPIKNLYLCGASTRAGHGVVGSMSSGQHAAFCIGRDQGRAVT